MVNVLVVGDPHGSKKVKKIPVREADLILVTGDIGKADIARKRAFEDIERRNKLLTRRRFAKSLRELITEKIVAQLFL